MDDILFLYRLKNCVFHLMRSKGLEKWIQEQHSGRVREPLMYVAKVQSQWERRVLKSLNSMCMELGQSLAKPRCQNEQQELLSKQKNHSLLMSRPFLFQLIGMTCPTLIWIYHSSDQFILQKTFQKCCLNFTHPIMSSTVSVNLANLLVLFRCNLFLH